MMAMGEHLYKATRVPNRKTVLQYNYQSRIYAQKKIHSKDEIKDLIKLGIAVCAFNPRTQEAEAEGFL